MRATLVAVVGVVLASPAALGGPRPVPDPSPAGPPDPDIGSLSAPSPPDNSLDRTSILAGVATVRTKVMACGEQAVAGGRIRVKVTVRPDGKVESATTDGSGDAVLEACVVKVMKTARFAKSASGGSFSFPFAFPAVDMSDTLDSQVMEQGLAKLEPKIAACHNAGKVTALRPQALKVDVNAKGKVVKVWSYAVSGDVKTDACVERVFKAARFGTTKDGGSFTYPRALAAAANRVTTTDPLATTGAPTDPFAPNRATTDPLATTGAPTDPFATSGSATAQVTVSGELDPAAIIATIARSKVAITRCGDASTINGKVTATVQVGADGKVTSATASGSGDGKLDACVASVMKTLTFPKSKAGGSFTSPFVFTHDSGGTPVDPFAANAVDDLGPADISEGVAKVKAKIRACGDASMAGGTVKVTVKVGADGKVASATAEGSTDAALDTCVATVIKTATFAKKKNGGAFSYPFVFGLPDEKHPPQDHMEPTPQMLDRAMISDGIGKVKAKIVACGDKSTIGGTVKANVHVGADGTVTSATASGSADTMLDNCVAAVIKTATFAKTQTGGAFDYPFVFGTPKGPDQVSGGIPTPQTPGESLDRSQISDGINKVKDAISKCGDGKTKGTVKVTVAVAPSGTVKSVKVTQAPAYALGSCVQEAISKATFAKTAQGGSFSYPFVF